MNPVADPFFGEVDPEGRLTAFWSGTGGLMCVVGPAGVGKSRAMAELAAHRDCARVSGSRVPGQLDPHGPIVVDG
ncbi:MAG: hypothetical protein KC656_10450, partial [Myxococcales bacterium]|nr:hypothetical protein [Myxococcales bacterium]